MAAFKDSCTVNQRSGRLYKIGYKYCYENLYNRNKGKYTVGFLTVYNLCYDHGNQQTLYVDYEINSLKLLRSEEIYEEEKIFITKPTTFGYEVANFEEDLKFMESAMKDFTWERENTTVPPFKHRAMLASRLHFPFVQLKRVLFHYSNIILVYNNIIQLFLETQEFITTISTIDELRIFAVPLYIRSDEEGYDNWEKYTPYAIDYLIFNKEETKGIAIILHNEDEEMDSSKLQCNAAIECPENYQINIINQLDVKLKGLVYCCNVNDVMNKWTFHPLQEKSDFDILNI